MFLELARHGRALLHAPRAPRRRLRPLLAATLIAMVLGPTRPLLAAGAAPAASPVPAPAPAPAAPSPGDDALASAATAFVIPFEKYTLANGLEVILHRDPSLPNV